MREDENAGELAQSLEGMQEYRGWIIGLGIALVVLGIIMLSSVVVATILTINLLGILLFITGIIQTVHAFWVRPWKGFSISLLNGVFLLAAGVYILFYPLASLAVLTILLGGYFIVSGVVKTVFALRNRYKHWGWLFFSGIVSVLLGALLWKAWPISSLYTMGLFLGVDLLLLGLAWLVTGITVRRHHHHHRQAF